MTYEISNLKVVAEDVMEEKRDKIP